MTALSKITNRINLHGDPDLAVTPRPLLTLEEFFEGNNVVGSIGCNLETVPEPAEFYALLLRIRNMRNVADVRVQVTAFDNPDWPFSDTIWIITSEPPEEVSTWFHDPLMPDDCWWGWVEGQSYEVIEMPPDMEPVACWWG